MDVSLHVFLHFLARRLALALREQGFPPFLGLLLHRPTLSSVAILYWRALLMNC